MSKYAIGVDYGTLSVRALLVNIETGAEEAVSIYEYPHGVMETHIPSGAVLPAGWALQDPQDYLEGLIVTIRDIVNRKRILPGEVVGIGLDFTASTVMPVKADKTPLCHMAEFQNEPHAYVKLWKHHGAEEEARIMDRVARERQEEWLPIYGGKISSEWMFPKIYETLRHAPEVYEAADRFMEAGDWIIWQMTGKESRSACGAGYKAYYHHEKGYPSKAFFKAVDKRMENIMEEKLDAPIMAIGDKAGYLTESMAREMGLMEGIPVGTWIIDA
ncbi:MAG: ribulokinase, partial [Clostridiales bacterium]|nr:ribulokinase [Clostridiales bacterium]